MRFLSAPAEDERVAPLQPNDRFPFHGQPHEQGADLRLTATSVLPGYLADVVQFGAWPALSQQLVPYQPVVHYRVCASQDL